MDLVTEIFLTHHSRKCTLHGIHHAYFHSSNHLVFRNASVTLLPAEKKVRRSCGGQIAEGVWKCALQLHICMCLTHPTCFDLCY